MTKNKTGAEKIMSVYWFVILFLVAGAIVYMVITFYGKPYDVREIEAGLLADKAADCVSYAGYFNNTVLNPDFNPNILEKCGINFNVEDAYGWKQQGQYFLQIDFYNFSSFPNSAPISEVSAGNSNLKIFCNKGQTSPFCLEREMYSLGKDGKQYTIKITAIVQKIEKNTQ